MKIIFADDHELIRQSVSLFLKQLAEEVQIFEAENASQAYELAQQHPDADLVLLDLSMPGMHGLEGVRTFRDRFPELPVVVLSASEEHDDIEQVLDAGALGFVPKKYNAQVMLNALRLVLSGGVYLPPILLSRAAGAPEKPKPAPEAPSRNDEHVRLDTLTERQRQVLEQLAQGKPNKLIARALGLQEGTVKMHLATIFRVLNVNNRVEAVLAGQKFVRGERKG